MWIGLEKVQVPYIRRTRRWLERKQAAIAVVQCTVMVGTEMMAVTSMRRRLHREEETMSTRSAASLKCHFQAGTCCTADWRPHTARHLKFRFTSMNEERGCCSISRWPSTQSGLPHYGSVMSLKRTDSVVDNADGSVRGSDRSVCIVYNSEVTFTLQSFALMFQLPSWELE